MSQSSRRRGASLVALLGGAAALTILTQVGGVVLLLAAALGRWLNWPAAVTGLAFLGLYTVFTLAIVPPAARALAREPLPCLVRTDRPYGAVNPLLCALNRNYVAPRTKAVIAGLADHMAKAYPGTITRYLDAGFPFLDGFPLMPHLSHRDGLKADLAYYYREADGRPVLDGAAGPLGYWAYEAPASGEIRPCAGLRGPSLRWNFSAWQPLVTRRADVQRMKAMLTWLTTGGRDLGLNKILIEPHLKQRWSLGVNMVRFQGCRAARHDDHLHLELAKQ